MCEICGGDLNPARPGVYKLVQGWALTRSTGGANVNPAQELGRYRHKACHEHGDMGQLFESVSHADR